MTGKPKRMNWRDAFLLLLIWLIMAAAFPALGERGHRASGKAASRLRSCLPERREYLEFRDHVDSLYAAVGLGGDLRFGIFELAMIGYYNMLADSLIARESIVTIIDYTRPSTEERLFVIDLDAGNLIYRSLVAHGLNTGGDYAEDFSNKPGSLQTSIGFYVTGDDYYGRHGEALKLNGVDTLYNDRAESRHIVIHGAWYCSEKFIDEYGRLGRSWGCPVLPLEISSEIIDAVKDGTCLFAYADDDEYMEESIYLEINGAVEEFRNRRQLR